MDDIMSLPLLPPIVFKALSTEALGEIRGAEVVNTDDGLVLIVKIGEDRRVLAQHRGGPRFFKTFDAAASMLKNHGIESWTANATGWIPKAQLLKMKSA